MTVLIAWWLLRRLCGDTPKDSDTAPRRVGEENYGNKIGPTCPTCMGWAWDFSMVQPVYFDGDWHHPYHADDLLAEYLRRSGAVVLHVHCGDNDETKH